MPNSTYLPVADLDKSIWLKNFAVKFPLYSVTLGFVAADTTSATNDSLMVAFSLEQDEFFRNEWLKRVAYKNKLFSGAIGSNLGVYPVTSPAPTSPTVVAAGVFLRIAGIIQRIKKHPNYTEIMGQDMGLESHAVVQAFSTMTELQPVLTIIMNAGHPVLKWLKGDTTAADLYVDRGDGKGFIFLATATVPHYTDTVDLPAGTTTAQWTYEAIYKTGDDQVGVMSNPVSVAVKHLI